MSEANARRDWQGATREKGRSVAGTNIFTTLRILDVPLQYWLLSSGVGITLIRRLGGAPTTASPSITTLGLSPYHTLILSLAIGSSLKQLYWNLFINDTVFPAGFATFIGFYNSLLNTINTLLAVWSLTSQQPRDQSSLKAFLLSAPPALLLGVPLYAVGIFTEWYSEVQRKAFKAKPENKGKPYSSGLFGLARNINYGGYTCWRTGYSLICGGWVWGVMMTAWLAGDFCSRAIPSMDAYCQQRYGKQWDEVRRTVPYKLLPYIY